MGLAKGAKGCATVVLYILLAVAGVFSYYAWEAYKGATTVPEPPPPKPKPIVGTRTGSGADQAPQTTSAQPPNPVRRDASPDWAGIYDRHYQDAVGQFQSPKTGAEYDVVLLNGATIRGALVYVGASSVQIKRGAATIEYTAEQIAPESRARFFPHASADLYAKQHVDAAKAEYAKKEEARRQREKLALADKRAQLAGEIRQARSSFNLEITQRLGDRHLCYVPDREQFIFIYGLSSGYVDGDQLSVDGYFTGIEQYKTVLGAPKTVRCYTVTPPASFAAKLEQLAELDRRLAE
jgi:hypothetical protein